MIQRVMITVMMILISVSTVWAGDFESGPEKLVLTLDDAVELAMKNNRDILLAREGEKRAGQQIREARSGAFPHVNLTGQYTRMLKKPFMFFEVDGEVLKFSPGFINTVNQALTVTQTLYAGGRTWTAIKIANLYDKSFQEMVKQTEKNVRLQVRESFLGLLLSQEALKISQKSLENAEAHLGNVRELFNNDMASEFDLLRAEVQVSNVTPQTLQAENAIVLQKDFLKNLIGISLDTEIELVGELIASTIAETEIESASEEALYNRNDYKNLTLVRDAYEQNVKIERSGYLPTLAAVYAYSYQGQSDDWSLDMAYRSQNVMLNLSMNLFDGFRTSAKMQQAKISVKETEYQLIKLREGIDIQITQARHSMEDAKKRIDATAMTVEMAQRAYNIAKVRFESGQGTQLEIFDSQIALEMAQLNRLQSIFDYEVSKVRWENAVGR